MRQLVAALVAAGLAACNGSHQRRVSRRFDSRSTRIRSPFSRCAWRETLGYYAEEAVSRSKCPRWREGRRRSRRCSAVAWMSPPRRCRMRCNWPSKGVTCEGFSSSTYAADRGVGGRAVPERQDPHDPRSERPYRWCLRSGVREPSDPQLSPCVERAVARRRQHRVRRHVGQFRGRTRARDR